MITTSSVPSAEPAAWQHVGRRIACAVFGHEVDNRVFAAAQGVRRCTCCAEVILREDGTETRIRHDLRCFLVHHEYAKMGARDLHNEYVCRACGHTLLFEQRTDRHAAAGQFYRRARYRCNVFGHTVHRVSQRDGFVEYACDTCGHPFLKATSGLDWVTHPPINIFIGHYVRFVTRRDGHAEHVCRHSGHTFSFATGPGPATAPTNLAIQGA